MKRKQSTVLAPISVAAAVLALAIGALPTVLVLLAAPARAELPAGQEIDQLDTCLGCHDLSDALEAPHQHAPAAGGDCSACHNPHVSRFEALLLDQPGPLCSECHGDVADALDRPVVHAPVAEGRCAECHAPHGGEHKALLRAEGAELCATCHDEVGRWRERPVRHVPFATGECAVCHDPHATDEPGLVRGSVARICTSCHSVDGAFRSAHGGYPVERAPCQQCHDPHASERPGLFRESIHEPFAGGDCTVCHAEAGADQPFALTLEPGQPQGELCGQCHPDAVEEALAAPFPHVPAGGGECTACHNPHTGSGQGLLREDEGELCLSCHDPGGAKSGEEGRHLEHGGSVACTDCHGAHGGEEPMLFTQSSIDTCAACHSHEHGVTHPLGEETRDPRNGAPMTCRSCHGIHDGPYEFYLHRSGEGELCVGCHKEIGGRR